MQLAPEFIVFLAILGAIVFVCMGFGVSQIWAEPENPGRGMTDQPPQQERYMRDVRRRNHEDAIARLSARR